MASPLLGLPKAISKAMAGVFFPATLARDAFASGPNDWTPGAVTTTEYDCRALVEDWSAYQIGGGQVAAGERKVMILAFGLSVEPQAGDRVTVRGDTFAIVSDGGSLPAVTTDPASAVWTCRGRI